MITLHHEIITSLIIISVIEHGSSRLRRPTDRTWGGTVIDIVEIEHLLPFCVRHLCKVPGDERALREGLNRGDIPRELGHIRQVILLIRRCALSSPLDISLHLRISTSFIIVRGTHRGRRVGQRQLAVIRTGSTSGIGRRQAGRARHSHA